MEEGGANPMQHSVGAISKSRIPTDILAGILQRVMLSNLSIIFPRNSVYLSTGAVINSYRV